MHGLIRRLGKKHLQALPRLHLPNFRHGPLMQICCHLYEIDQTAYERMELLTAQMTAAEGVTEDLKSRDQMQWLGRMNNIRARAEEVIREELIYS